MSTSPASSADARAPSDTTARRPAGGLPDRRPFASREASEAPLPRRSDGSSSWMPESASAHSLPDGSSEVRPPRTARTLDLVAIETSLRALQGALPAVNRSLLNDHPPLLDSSIGAMLAGYAELDRLALRGIDLFARGQARRLLDLNRIVLYGERSPRVRAHARALDTAERHFYESRAGGVGDLVEWYERHRTLSPSRLAAGLYLRLQCSPQLYIEGNHRTGALILSHVLMRRGRPPFVLTPALAGEWFALTPELQRLNRHGAAAILQGRRLQRCLADLIRRLADPRHLTSS